MVQVTAETTAAFLSASRNAKQQEDSRVETSSSNGLLVQDPYRLVRSTQLLTLAQNQVNVAVHSIVMGKATRVMILSMHTVYALGYMI